VIVITRIALVCIVVHDWHTTDKFVYTICIYTYIYVCILYTAWRVTCRDEEAAKAAAVRARQQALAIEVHLLLLQLQRFAAFTFESYIQLY
jgi:ABC-type transport system involved in Fe-S cluster assembly fused permease/ATPase subunit